MPMDLFTNNGFTTLAVNVLTQPAAGTVETWTVGSTAAPLPQAGTSGTLQYRAVVGPVTDATPEIIWVLDTLSATTLSVLRGAESSPIKQHFIGDPINHVATAGTQMMGNNPYGQAYSSAAPNISTTYVAVGCSSNIVGAYLQGGMVIQATSTTNIGLVVPVNGIYLVTGNIAASAVSGTSSQLEVGHNGRSSVLSATTPTATANTGGANLWVSFSDQCYFAAGALITLYGRATVASMTPIAGGNVNNMICATLVSRAS